jgi:hypothetical protein
VFGWKRQLRPFGDNCQYLLGATLGLQLFEHPTSRVDRHDTAPAIREWNGHSARARANV